MLTHSPCRTHTRFLKIFWMFSSFFSSFPSSTFSLSICKSFLVSWKVILWWIFEITIPSAPFSILHSLLRAGEHDANVRCWYAARYRSDKGSNACSAREHKDWWWINWWRGISSVCESGDENKGCTFELITDPSIYFNSDFESFQLKIYSCAESSAV